MKIYLGVLAMILAATLPAAPLVHYASPYTFAETQTRLEQLASERGLTIFAKIDHAAAATAVDLNLRPSTLFIMGNPKAGTLLMHCSQTLALELPLRILLWQDEQGKIWLTHNELAEVAQRHQVADCPVLPRIEMVLGALLQAVVAPELEETGLLQYFPPEVKSVEAWHGQEFKVGSLPILPQTPEQKAQLQKLLGQTITVRGTWFEGKPWQSDPRLPQPLGESRRGYGLLLEAIIPANNSLKSN